MPTLRAFQLRHSLTPKDALQDVLEWCGFQCVLQPVEDHVEELLGILLNRDVDWLTSEVFEGETKIIGVVVQAVTTLQKGEHPLELVEDIIINQDTILGTRLHVLILQIIGHQDRIPERRSEEELLQHGDHVADAPQVLDAQVPVASLVVTWNMIPRCYGGYLLRQRSQACLNQMQGVVWVVDT